MTLYEKIMSIYPLLEEKDFMTNIVLQNDSDGKGDYIAEWNNVKFDKPSEEQLSAVK